MPSTCRLGTSNPSTQLKIQGLGFRARGLVLRVEEKNVFGSIIRNGACVASGCGIRVGYSDLPDYSLTGSRVRGPGSRM